MCGKLVSAVARPSFVQASSAPAEIAIAGVAGLLANLLSLWFSQGPGSGPGTALDNPGSGTDPARAYTGARPCHWTLCRRDGPVTAPNLENAQKRKYNLKFGIRISNSKFEILGDRLGAK